MKSRRLMGRPRAGRSLPCREAIKCPAANKTLFDHFVGAGQHQIRTDAAPSHVGHFAFVRSAAAASCASRTTLAWSSAVNLPDWRNVDVGGAHEDDVGALAGRERAGLLRDAEVDAAVERSELNQALHRERDLVADAVLMQREQDTHGD